MLRVYTPRALPSPFCLPGNSRSAFGARWHEPCRRRLFNSQVSADPEKLNILFFGRDEFSCRVFGELFYAQDVWKNLAIVTNPDEKVGRRGSKLSVSPLKLLGHHLKSTTNSNTLDETLLIHEIPSDRAAFRTWKPPTPFNTSPSDPPHPNNVLITASFGRILPASLLARFTSSHALNVHPSLLPALRGPAPIQRALAAGADKTGVCVIGMTKVVKKGVIDVGDVWGREVIAVPKGATFPEMREALAEQGGRLLVQVLRGMLKGNAKATPQSAYAAETSDPPPYAHFITAEDARIRWEEMSASQIMNMYNAISHQRPLHTYLPDARTMLQIHRASVPTQESIANLPPGARPGTAALDPASKHLLVRCAHGETIAFGEAKIQDKKLVPAKDFWNGVREGWWERVDGNKVVRLRTQA